MLKVNIVFERDLVKAQRHHFSEGQKWQMFGKVKGGQKQMGFPRALNICQSIVPRNWSRF